MNEPTNTGRWRRADVLFAAALDLPASDRAKFVRSRCAGDSALLREVETLLRAGEVAGRWLSAAAEAAVGGALIDALESAGPDAAGIGDRSGERLGPWRLLSRIGRGGMADVYVAERADGAFEQRVAVKIQRRGLDAEDVLARFRTERQILSGLAHPHIARLLDGGSTEDGLPYLVMEHVEGRPITDYCDEHRLSVAERMRLFVQIARAVQAAHARLVVHRDIKPSNVLVTAEGQVKLVDFGIAKLLDPAAWPGETLRTRTGFRPLTPEYASPEQVRGEPITTASDIYQLGLLLYRLLTGGRPYEARAGRALEEAITDTAPSRPSDFVEEHGWAVPAGLDPALLVRWLRGDVDTIVLHAIRKEPERRYASAQELAEDVRRHLEGLPISARQDSRLYRAGKFLRRNSWITPAAVAVLAALGLYVATLIRHGRQLEAERNVARLEAEKAETTQQFLIELFESADPFSGAPASRRDITVREVMEVGFERARAELDSEPEVQAALLGTIGDVFLGLGDAQRALEVHKTGYDFAEHRFGPGSPEAALALRKMIEPSLQSERGRDGFAHETTFLALRALSTARQAYGNDHDETLRAELALGSVLHANQRFEPAVILLSHALEGLRGHEEASPADLLLALRRLASAAEGLDRSWEREQKSPRVAGYAREIMAVAEEAYGPDHPRTIEARLHASLHLPDDEAIQEQRRAIPALREHLGPAHDFLARTYFLHGNYLRSAGQPDSAITNYRGAVDVWRRSGDSPMWHTVGLETLATVYLSAGRPAEAATAWREALEVARTAPAGSLGSANAEEFAARLSIWAGWASLQAEAAPGEVLRTVRAALSTAPDTRWTSTALCVEAVALARLGRAAEAVNVASLGLGKRAELGLTAGQDSFDPRLDPCDVLPELLGPRLTVAAPSHPR